MNIGMVSVKLFAALFALCVASEKAISSVRLDVKYINLFMFKNKGIINWIIRRIDAKIIIVSIMETSVT